MITLYCGFSRNACHIGSKMLRTGNRIFSYLISRPASYLNMLPPSGRFRHYLARAVRNYIINRLEAERARFRAADNAKTYSDISREDQDLASSLADPRSLSDDEEFLTKERALSCLESAIDGVIQWARESGIPEKIEIAEKLHRKELGRNSPPKQGPP